MLIFFDPEKKSTKVPFDYRVGHENQCAFSVQKNPRRRIIIKYHYYYIFFLFLLIFNININLSFYFFYYDDVCLTDDLN